MRAEFILGLVLAVVFFTGGFAVATDAQGEIPRLAAEIKTNGGYEAACDALLTPAQCTEGLATLREVSAFKALRGKFDFVRITEANFADVNAYGFVRVPYNATAVRMRSHFFEQYQDFKEYRAKQAALEEKWGGTLFCGLDFSECKTGLDKLTAIFDSLSALGAKKININTEMANERADGWVGIDWRTKNSEIAEHLARQK